MQRGFWNNMKQPILALAPMADVTDAAFRRMFAKYGKPDVTWTEFVSVDGLFLMPEKEILHRIPEYERVEEIARKFGVSAGNPLLYDLMYTEAERPIVAQFFSRDPERMERAAALAVALGFDGVDINMGCPAQVICRQGSGAAMIKDPLHAQEVIRATMRGAESGGDRVIPVSVKTRLGYNQIQTEEWLPYLLETNPAAVTLHARTRKEMSKVPAHWDEISKAVGLRDEAQSDVLILGNGDVANQAEAIERVKETGADGVMVGRGIFGNPWWFNRELEREDIPLPERLHVMVEHTKLFEYLLGSAKNFALMKKHFKAYVNGWEGAAALRTELMTAANAAEVEQIVNSYLASSRTADLTISL
jgi:tRNA-dihydrouridine synthase